MIAAPPRPVRFADLGLRVASGLALAVVAFLDIWAGGAWAAGFIALILALMLWEYHRMVTGDGRIGSTHVPGSVTRSKQLSEPILFGTCGAITALSPNTE